MEKIVSKIDLLKSVREQGLPGIVAFLQKRLKREWAVFDEQGKVLCCSQGLRQPLDLYRVLPVGSREFYDERGMFLYGLTEKPQSLLAVVECAIESVEAVRQVLELTTLAMAFYWQSQQEAHRLFESVETDLMEQLFGGESQLHNDFLPLGHFNLNKDKPYVIQLIQPKGKIERNQIQQIVERMVVYTESNQLPSMRPIYWRGNLVHIIPALYENETFEIRKEWPELRVSEVFKDIVAKELGIELAVGIGQIYPLSQLEASYREARIALAFKGILTGGGYVQRFSDMGFFRYIFSRSQEENRRYVYDRLGPILSYDNQKNVSFLNTLRILLDNGLNWKETAEKCGVHVNTIYYRVERIEKMLGLEVQNAAHKFELFVAIKIWDVLKSLGVIDDAYVGFLDKTAGKNGGE